MEGAKLSKIADEMKLTNFTEEMDLSEHQVRIADINRPALQLNGFYDHFEKDRIQLIGMVEKAYMDKKTEEQKEDVYDKFLSHEIPCVIFCREFVPSENILQLAYKYNVPLLGQQYFFLMFCYIS